jgi:hypothetical protein
VSKLLVSICLCVLFLSVAAAAQTAGGQRGQGTPQAPPTPPASTSAEVLGIYTNITNFIARTAAMVPAEKFTWQPTPEVRTFARLFAHITDDNNGACSALAGVTPAPARMDTGNDKDGWAANKMPKADLEKALADSVTLCNKAFAAVDQTNMMEMQGRRTRIGALIYNTSHINEHYGNLVTYLRLNNMVPPSSAPRGGGLR